MLTFGASLAAFVLLHVGVSGTGLRRGLQARLGENAYRGLFSLASVVLLVAMIWTYGAARASAANVDLWSPPALIKHLGAGIAVLGVWLAIMGYLAPNPTAIGMDFALKRDNPATGITRVTRHPFLWGVALWGFGHVLMNGDRASLALFVGLAGMCLLGTRSIDAKTADRDPEAWARLAAVSSNVPFAAIAQGRTQLSLKELAWRPFAAAAVVAAAWIWHGVIVGVPVALG
jgi:uncharacterized membrane protein